MRKLLIALLVLVSIFAFVSCDDSKNVPDEITVSTWDGTSADTTWYSKDVKEYTLTEASQLAGLAKLVNDGNALSGVTIKLANNINLNDKNWTPIGLYSDENDSSGFVKKVFSGTFDGQNHVIAGLKITCDTDKSSYRALFGYVNGKVCNLTVEGEVKALDASGVVAALGDGGKLENIISKVDVSVSKTSSDLHAKVAGIVVAVKKGDSGCTIKNCTNYGKITSTSTTANDFIGGILATAWDDVKNLTIENCTNEGEVSTTSQYQAVGGIIGCLSGSSKNTQIKGCTNNGKITAAGTNMGGAIIGVIRSGATGAIAEDCKPTENQVGSGSFTAVTTGTNT